MPVGRIIAVLVLAVVVIAAAAACGRTKEDIIERAHKVTTRTELQKVVGRPDDIAKLGPAEIWTYRAKNGEVIFVVIGEQVTLQAAGSGDRKSR